MLSVCEEISDKISRIPAGYDSARKHLHPGIHPGEIREAPTPMDIFAHIYLDVPLWKIMGFKRLQPDPFWDAANELLIEFWYTSQQFDKPNAARFQLRSRHYKLST